MIIDLTNKRVIVTGASRGIGRGIATAFAREGCRLAIGARTEAAIHETAEELRPLAGDLIVRRLDVADDESVKGFVAEVAEKWGGVDVLVNNAGQGQSGTLDNLTAEQLLAHANILQMGHFRMAQAVVPHMRVQRWGRIIDINAVAGSIPTPDGIPSVINRASCIALSKLLGQALAPDNILVNSLNMGWINTGQWDRHYKEMPPGVSREEFDEMVLKVVPMGRFGTPEDVAGVALFLASDLATFISGVEINVSGGLGGQITYYPKLKREFGEAMKARYDASLTKG
ncbi:SDR family oxidoreductase [Sphingobium naphthae]|uniref:SDR family oxidoreductase n=1 Tax=Sphingobium naphthae TaxID=1886786 RepID=A0ABU4A149_9SPHN|nr:SDR family oxidoreductase [Sphingobium naphthae]MCC4250814.1 SDR family oxidoreductase [Sphingobium naphthae]MDV5825455.1 SDR family oxidoreductase [Sphingobium naphthae]